MIDNSNKPIKTFTVKTKRMAKEIIRFIQDYYDNKSLKGCIIGISGGKDSAVAAAIMCNAIGAENVIGVTLPCHSKSQDAEDAKLIADHYGFKLVNLDLTNVFDSFKEEASKIDDFNDEKTENSDINLKPRLRMAAQYYLAAMYSAIYGGTYLVVGTSNKCELYVGYFTKGGDSVHDIAPLAELTVSEVISIGEYFGVPEKVLYKTPSDGLSDETDEEKLGVSYKEIESVIKGKQKDDIILAKVGRLHVASAHKFNIPRYRNYF